MLCVHLATGEDDSSQGISVLLHVTFQYDINHGRI